MTSHRAAILFALSILWNCGAHARDIRDLSNYLFETSIAKLHVDLKGGSISCEEVIEYYLERISAHDKVAKLNSIQTINLNAAEEARNLDKISAGGGWGGILHCVPVLLKDTFETKDMPTSFGSTVFHGWMSDRDAIVVKRLKSEGAIILAKTTMGEFGNRYYGSSFGVARNPYDPLRNPSGSSVGTAIGVSMNFGLVGIGEDSTGSIRGPAAVTGLVGLRPTHGSIDVTGMMPATPSADTLGPITRSSEDAALVLEVIIDDSERFKSLGFLGDKIIRVGVINAPISASTDAQSNDYEKVHNVINLALDQLAHQRVTVVEGAVPDYLDNVRILEAKGFDSYEMEAAINGYLQLISRPPALSLGEILDTGVVAAKTADSMRAALGRSVDDIEYDVVQSQRRQLRESILRLMEENELSALAYATYDHQTTIIPENVLVDAGVIDEFGRGDNRNLSPITGLPAITIPVGLTADGLPVGLEFIAKPFEEAVLLELARRVEIATHGRVPPALALKNPDF